ncbi:MAG: GntR family transcriptional regulator, partial [Frankiaceae bacterium]|nr:GntR family transcriptional regulator [Frankiaceae bacterium]
SKRATIRGMVLESKVIPAFAAIRQRLELPEGASVAVTEGVVLEGDEPLALFVSYVELSPEQAQLLGEDGLSVIAFLEKHLGVFVVESDAVMTALACDKQTSELLHIPEGSPILLIEDLLRDADARPWAVCQLRCRADRMAFSATARRRAH